MKRSVILPRLLRHAMRPGTVREIAARMGTSEPSAASACVKFARLGYLQVVGVRAGTGGRAAKIYRSAE